MLIKYNETGEIVTSWKYNKGNNVFEIFSNDKEFHGVLEGYDIVEKNFKVTSIENTNEIEVGSQVVTNGLGGIYPNGIFVGTVSKTTKDELGISTILKVESKIDFTKIGYVFVLGK